MTNAVESTSTSTGIPERRAAESGVLSGCLSEGAKWWAVVRHHSGGDPLSLFNDPTHRMVAGAIDRAANSSAGVTQLSVEDQLAIQGVEVLSGSNVQTYLAQLQGNMSITTLSALNTALGVLVDARTLRVMLRGLESTAGRIRDGAAMPTDIIGDLRALSLNSDVSTTAIPLFGDVIAEMAKHPEANWYLPTGLSRLDHHLHGGWTPGCTYVVAARPKIGKSTLAINSAIEALNQDAVVLFVSMEMSYAEIAAKFLSSISEVPEKILRDLILGRASDSTLSSEERSNLKDARKYLSTAKLHVAFAADIRDGADSIVSAMMNLRTQYGEDKKIIVFIDYIGLLPNDGYNKTAQISEMSRSLKLASAELQVATVILAQINREGVDGMPRAHMLRDSGSLEQDASAVILLHRPAATDPSEPGHIIQINVEIVRSGTPGQFEAFWEPQYALVQDLDPND